MRAILSIKLVLLSVLASASLVGLVACDSGSKEFNLEILRGALTLSPAVLRLEQHREVVLKIKTDEAGTLRIPDINVESQLDPSKTNEVTFTAAQIGRSEVTWQAEGRDAPVNIAALDVFPSR